MENYREKRKNAGAGRVRAVVLLGISILFLCACAGRQEEAGTAGTDRDTPEKAVAYTMEKLKELDMEAFNGCTDNYVRTYRNWLGFPTEREYRVFNELMDTDWKKGSRYEANYRLAEKSLERMNWEIKDVREETDRAEIDMEITNIDMMEVLGNYEVYQLEYMMNEGNPGIGQFVKGMLNLTNVREDLVMIMDALGEEDIRTVSVTVQAYKEEGQWKVHLSQEFIEAFMGYGDSEGYSEEMEQRIEELESRYEEEMEKWAQEWAAAVKIETE